MLYQPGGQAVVRSIRFIHPWIDTKVSEDLPVAKQRSAKFKGHDFVNNIFIVPFKFIIDDDGLDCVVPRYLRPGNDNKHGEL